MKTAFYSAKPYEVETLRKVQKDKIENFEFIEKPLNLKTVKLAKSCDSITAFSNDDLSKSVLKEISKLGIKVIALRSAGYDHVDLEAANEFGIQVANVPEYSPYAIAEHTIMLMLALNRKLMAAQKLIAKNNFELDTLVGFDMNNKTVGVIGTGHIGSVVVKILHGFSCKILAVDPAPNSLIESAFNINYVELDELYRHSDIISIHCPLTPETKYLINKKTISKMKKGVMLINTSRGGIINTADAIEALENKHIAYLGLDVYENEKGLFFYNHSQATKKDKMLSKLLKLDNVLVTGHQGFLTTTALQNIAETTVSNLSQMLKKQPCPNLLTS